MDHGENDRERRRGALNGGRPEDRRDFEQFEPPHFLCSVNLLANVLGPRLAELARDARSLALKEGDTLFRRGDAADQCFWLRRGYLSLSVSSSRGENRIIGVVGPGATVGELSVLATLPRNANCQALTDCHVVCLSAPAVIGYLKAAPEHLEHLTSTLLSEVRTLASEAVLGTFLSTRGRVARSLLKLAAHVGRGLPEGLTEITCPLRHSDLAGIAGVTRESVSRLLGEWRRDGVVRLSEKGGTLIVSPAKLSLEIAAEA